MSRHDHGRGPGSHPFLQRLGIGAVTFGGAAAAIGASYKVAEFLVKGKKLFEVRSENAVFVRLVERVRIDLAEAERLMALKSVQDAMRGNKAKTLYIQRLIHSVHEAIEGMNKYTSKVAGAGRWLRPDTRLWWVLHEHDKLKSRQAELAMAREGIMEVIGHLGELEGTSGDGGASDGRPEALENHRISDMRREAMENRTEYRETRREDRPGPRHMSTSRHVDADIDIDVEGRDRRHERHVVETDHARPPFRGGEQRRGDQYVEKIYEIERPYHRGDWSQAGLYDGRLDGPLGTRPRFWTQQSAGADVSLPRGSIKVTTLTKWFIAREIERKGVPGRRVSTASQAD